MSIVSTLPSRPLTAQELYALHEGDQFVAVVPVNTVTDPDEQRQRPLIFGAIFATHGSIVAVEYSPDDRQWTKVFEAENAPAGEKNAEGVVESVVEAAETALKEVAAEIDVGEEVSGDADDGETFREAAAFGRLLQQQYDEAASE